MRALICWFVLAMALLLNSNSGAQGTTYQPCDPPAGGWLIGASPTKTLAEFAPFALTLTNEEFGGRTNFEFDFTLGVTDRNITLRPHLNAFRAPPLVTPDEGVPPTTSAPRVLLPGLPPGQYRVRFEDGEGRSASRYGVALPCAVIEVAPTGAKVRAQTLVYGDLLRYFLTTSQSEVDALLAQTPNRSEWSFAAWQTTDAGFNVWPATGEAPGAAKAVCRLFNTRASSHFYSASATDCATLAAQPDWRNEGTAFRALVPEGGVCGFGTDPVYRLFNTQRSNHRYTPSAETYRTLSGNSGWVGEGVAFCSPRG